MYPLELEDAKTRNVTDRLGPYALRRLEEAARFALQLHAEELTSEHLLASLLLDESAGASRMILHAFADPATIAGEVMALCPGILVVGSGRSLPFSVLAVRGLEDARAQAARRALGAVTTNEILWAVIEVMGSRQRNALRAAGYRADEVLAEKSDGDETEAASVPAEGPLFHHFDNQALRALGAACRLASKLERPAIGPVHVLLACLELDESLRGRSGLNPVRVRGVFGAEDHDTTPLAPRALSTSNELSELLGNLEHGASTLEILGRILTDGTDELRLLLVQQKVTPELYGRSANAFPDPESPAE